MIGAAQVDDLFAEKGITERAKQNIDIEIQWMSWSLKPYWAINEKGTTLCIPMNGPDSPEDLDPAILSGRTVWIWYDKSDAIAAFKAQILCNRMKADFINRPARAEFLDRHYHLRRLTDAGWKDMGGPKKEQKA